MSRRLLEKQDIIVVRGVDLEIRQLGFQFCFRHFLADSLAARFIRFFNCKRGTVIALILLAV
jgi:hypothetical protein